MSKIRNILLKNDLVHIFKSVLYADGRYPDNTGDIEYVEAVCDGILKSKSSSIKLELIGSQPELKTEEKIYDYIKSKGIKRPIFHLQYNFETGTGLGHTVDGIKNFKAESNAKVVMTSIEFKMYNTKHVGKDYAHKAIEYFKVADKLIFLDDADKKAAYSFFKEKYPEDEKTIKVIKSAKVIAVPPTVQMTNVPFSQRDERNIFFCGMIRSGKGLEHVMEIAELMKEHLPDKKIMIIGPAIEKSDNAQTVKETELGKIISKAYPSFAQDVHGFKHYDQLLELLEFLKDNKDTIKPELPVDLYINCPKEEQQRLKLFDKCGYALVFDFHGASLRNTGKSSFLNSKFVMYTNETDITPKSLRKGGEHYGAMVTIAEKNVSNAHSTIKDLKQRLTEAHHDAHTLSLVDKLNKVISKEHVGKQHAEVYGVKIQETQVHI